jgi:hypothetical protein
MTTTTPKPGCLKQCEACLFFLPNSWANGHPSPCSLCRWQGAQRLGPHIVDGRCDAYHRGTG